MPNWCSNNLEINGDEQELDKLECLMATGEQEFDFNVISKSPEGDDWFTWRMETWGTKLNAKEPALTRTSTTTMQARFDTAWSPPIPVITTLSGKFPRLNFQLKYQEEGLDFSGIVSFKDGIMIFNEYEGFLWDEEVNIEGTQFVFLFSELTESVADKAMYRVRVVDNDLSVDGSSVDEVRLVITQKLKQLPDHKIDANQ